MSSVEEVEPALKTSPAQLDSKPHSESDDSNGTQLDVTPGTPTIKLDRLGPMVVNSDGVCVLDLMSSLTHCSLIWR